MSKLRYDSAGLVVAKPDSCSAVSVPSSVGKRDVCEMNVLGDKRGQRPTVRECRRFFSHILFEDPPSCHDGTLDGSGAHKYQNRAIFIYRKSR